MQILPRLLNKRRGDRGALKLVDPTPDLSVPLEKFVAERKLEQCSEGGLMMLYGSSVQSS